MTLPRVATTTCEIPGGPIEFRGPAAALAVKYPAIILICTGAGVNFLCPARIVPNYVGMDAAARLLSEPAGGA